MYLYVYLYTTLNIEVSIYGSLAEFANIRIQWILVFWGCRRGVAGGERSRALARAQIL